MAHLYASFADPSLAEQAAGALLDYGVQKEDISVVANDQYVKTRETNMGTPGQAGDRVAETGDRAASAVTGAFGAEGTSAGYSAAAAERGMKADAEGTGRRVQVYDDTSVAADTGGASTSAMNAQVGNGDTEDTGGTEAAAKQGISVTTPEDAGEGAVKGTGWGLAAGIAASLAALAVPGVGLVLGGGALASALGLTALGAGAGAVAGGVTGYLKDQGVPADAADRYHGAVQSGGAVLSLNVPSGKVDQATAESVLSKYGAADVNTY